MNTEIQRIYPREFVGYEGSIVNVWCESDTPVLWRKNGEEFLSMQSLKQSEMGLILYNAVVADSGNYSCVGTYNGSLTFHDEIEILIGGIYIIMYMLWIKFIIYDL